MPLRRSRSPRLALSLLLFLGLVAAACASDPQEAAVAVEPDVPGLLPATEEPATEVVSPDPTSPPNVAAQPSAAAPVEEAAPTPTPDPLSCLSLRAQVAQLLLPLATQAELPGAQVFAADGELGGIGLLGSPDAGIAEAIHTPQNASFVPLLVASDEEGGSVQRPVSYTHLTLPTILLV